MDILSELSMDVKLSVPPHGPPRTGFAFLGFIEGNSTIRKLP
jgi:hypothetical protein